MGQETKGYQDQVEIQEELREATKEQYEFWIEIELDETPELSEHKFDQDDKKQSRGIQEERKISPAKY